MKGIFTKDIRNRLCPKKKRLSLHHGTLFSSQRERGGWHTHTHKHTHVYVSDSKTLTLWSNFYYFNIITSLGRGCFKIQLMSFFFYTGFIFLYCKPSSVVYYHLSVPLIQVLSGSSLEMDIGTDNNNRKDIDRSRYLTSIVMGGQIQSPF